MVETARISPIESASGLNFNYPEHARDAGEEAADKPDETEGESQAISALFSSDEEGDQATVSWGEARGDEFTVMGSSEGRKTIEYGNTPRVSSSEVEKWVPESLVTEERNLKLANTQEFRRIIIPILQWDDIPDMHNMCTCGGFDTRCEAEPHLVRVERLPTKSEWAGLVLQPRGIPLQVRLNRDVMLEAISPYLTSLVDNVHIPFYVVDEVREFTTGDNEIPSSS
ncbi:hypothetical protein BGX38DRAFT_1147019 [Terfezia claveryi]|nr:hypothetical protein BGX38DRAFT_1147019 [Terfezia claveryi]